MRPQAQTFMVPATCQGWPLGSRVPGLTTSDLPCSLCSSHTGVLPATTAAPRLHGHWPPDWAGRASLTAPPATHRCSEKYQDSMMEQLESPRHRSKTCSLFKEKTHETPGPLGQDTSVGSGVRPVPIGATYMQRAHKLKSVPFIEWPPVRRRAVWSCRGAGRDTVHSSMEASATWGKKGLCSCLGSGRSTQSRGAGHCLVSSCDVDLIPHAALLMTGP